MFVIESSSLNATDSGCKVSPDTKKMYSVTPRDWSSWSVSCGEQERLCIPDTILTFNSLQAYFARLGLPASLEDGVLYVEATWAQMCDIQKAMCGIAGRTSFWTRAT